MPRIKALLVGVNKYLRAPAGAPRDPVDTDRPWSALDVDEVMGMLEKIHSRTSRVPAISLAGLKKRKQIAIPQQILEPAGIEVMALLDAGETTLAGIRKGLDWLFAGSGKGDVLLFYFSGHGRLVRSDRTEGGVPRYDEALLPSDTDWDPVSPICLKDDEIGTRHTSQAWVEVLLDTCSAANFEGGDAPKVIRQFGCFYRGPDFPAGSGAVWAATEPETSAYSAAVDPAKTDVMQGLFTHFLCKALPDYLTRRKPREKLLEEVADALVACSTDRRNCHCSPFHQVPVLHCASDDLGRPPLWPGKSTPKPAAFQKPDRCFKHV